MDIRGTEINAQILDEIEQQKKTVSGSNTPMPLHDGISSLFIQVHFGLWIVNYPNISLKETDLNWITLIY